MTERRKYSRVNLDMPVKCKILDKQKKNEISYEISSRTVNISEGGVYLTWPVSWNCKVCSNCLVWIFNHSCSLKDGSPSTEQNKYLAPATFIRLEFAPPLVPHPVKVTAKVAWVETAKDKNAYPVGVSFLEEDKKKGDLDMVREKIAALKERGSLL